LYIKCVDVKQDAGSPPLSSQNELRIEVTDENDCRPVFTSDDYTVTVMENSSPGLFVFQLTAVDADLPGSPNSRLTYDLRPTTDGEHTALAVDPVCLAIIPLQHTTVTVSLQGSPRSPRGLLLRGGTGRGREGKGREGKEMGRERMKRWWRDERGRKGRIGP